MNSDSQGSGYLGAFLRHPFDALDARTMANEAQSQAQRLYPDISRHNDEADAFRHAYWNYNMAKTFGPEEAQSFGNAREIEKPDPAGERYMDLYNNKIGRDLAASGQGDPIRVVQDAVRRDLTRNSPFDNR